MIVQPSVQHSVQLLVVFRVVQPAVSFFTLTRGVNVGIKTPVKNQNIA